MIKNINVPENWKVSGNSGASSIQHVPIAPKDVIGDLDVVVNNKGELKTSYEDTLNKELE